MIGGEGTRLLIRTHLESTSRLSIFGGKKKSWKRGCIMGKGFGPLGEWGGKNPVASLKEWNKYLCSLKKQEKKHSSFLFFDKCNPCVFSTMPSAFKSWKSQIMAIACCPVWLALIAKVIQTVPTENCKSDHISRFPKKAIKIQWNM